MSGSMVFLLMPWITLQLTHSASSAGLAVTLTAIPGLLISPFSGSLVDKFGRRRAAIFMELLPALANLSVAVVAMFAQVNLTLFLALSVIRAVVGSGNFSARKSLIPDVATAGGITLEKANGIHESVGAAGFAMGPALASLCIGWLGEFNTFWVVAGLGLLATLITTLIRVTEHHESHDEDEGRHWVSYAVQGVKILFQTPSVLILMAAVCVLAIIYMPTELVVLPTYYTSIHNPQGLGFLIVVMAIFTTMGALLFERLNRRFSFTAILRVAILGVALSMVPMAFLPAQPVMLICGAFLGLAWGPLPPLLNTVIQRKIPANRRGRVFSLEMAIWTGGPILSMGLAGLAVDAFGVRIIYPVIVVLVLAAALVVATRKSLVDLNTADYQNE
jgi:DHA3 family macrolide efflux protein-like MFS transporter